MGTQSATFIEIASLFQHNGVYLDTTLVKHDMFGCRVIATMHFPTCKHNIMHIFARRFLGVCIYINYIHGALSTLFCKGDNFGTHRVLSETSKIRETKKQGK